MKPHAFVRASKIDVDEQEALQGRPQGLQRHHSVNQFMQLALVQVNTYGASIQSAASAASSKAWNQAELVPERRSSVIFFEALTNSST